MAKTKDNDEPAKNEWLAADEQYEAEHLVPMVKGDDEISVHPTCVKAHQAAGWTVKG